MNIQILLGQMINTFLDKLGLELKYKPLTLSKGDANFNRLFEKSRGRTLLSAERLFMLYQLITRTTKLEGDVAECGVYQGGSAKLLAHAVQKFSPGKRVFLLDTFEGMPETDRNKDQVRKGDFRGVDYEAIKAYLSDCPNIVFCKGMFTETLPGLRDNQFSFVHIDADIYSSMKECCEFFYPRMIKGGIMVFDDYDIKTCPGAGKAVDEFFDQKKESPVNLLTGQGMIIKFSE